MKYQVFWMPAAEERLTELWLLHIGERRRIRNAGDHIDALLESDPENCGQVLFDTVRTVAIDPLSVEFEVMQADRKVVVLSVYHVRELSS
jgi:hypothetical protein